MKVKGTNGIIFDVPTAVATGMIAAGLVEEVPSDAPEDSALKIAQLTDEGTADAGEPTDTGDSDEDQAPAEDPAASEE